MKKQIVSYLIENNELVKPEILERLKDPNTLKKAAKLVEEKAEAKQIIDVIKTNQAKEKEIKETEHKQNNRDGEDEDKWAVKVLFDYEKPALKKNVESFTKYFNNRFKQIEKLLLPRAENNISISRLANKTDRETVTVIGMIADKQLTKTNKVILTLEDQTGTIKALFSPNNQEAYKMAKDTVLDEVISVTGTAMKDLLFAEKMMLPEIPIRTEIKKSPEEAYAIFIADVHLGSNLFLEEEFGNFIDWLRGEYGTEEQKEIAKKTKYCFIAGDLVAGVGIYPKQEEELK
ncbi:MAG TPA: hypothetical protein ENF94_00915, partial [Candidatus Woesearchaeota archaeon]|nr:hypothetical protein [Candidatus Woesearchaeota archaeon]